jgi:hypothetical protein
MNRLLSAVCAVIVLGMLIAFRPAGTPVAPNSSFGKGEELTYKAKFGFFTVGSAVTRIDRKIHSINSRPCYKVEGIGQTADWVSIIKPVKDVFGAYLDTVHLDTQVAYRKLQEGDYRLDELSTFDHTAHKVEVKRRNKESGVYEGAKQYDIPANTKDIIGGFMLLRQIDFTRLKKQDTITISGFFEDKSYFLKVMYKGKDVVHTRIGKIPCHKLVPVMPDNKLFDGENSITVWISDDQNKIPVKMQAKMFVGHTGLELEGFRGLRNQLKIIM